MAKKKKWLKLRHKILTAVLRVFVHPYTVLKYNIKVERFKEQGKRAYLVLFNHQTAYDQFFVSMAFRGPVYYVASEDIFSMGWLSSLIKYIVAPIPIKKQSTDVSAVLNCMRVAKEGGTIAMAPEGNRTFSGKTEYMNPAIVPLVKKLKLPLALYRIEGGYGVHPRWSDEIRKGKMRSFVSKVVEPEDYLKLSDEELFELIKNELFVDEAVADGEFLSKNRAEYLERAIYVCPYCGLSEFESNGAKMKCKKCELEIVYNENKTISANEENFPFEFINDWYEYQNEFIKNTSLENYRENPIYCEKANLYKVNLYKNKELVFENASLKLFENKITFECENQTREFLFEDVSVVSVLGKNKLNFYFGDEVYQISADKRFNALKYVHIFYKHKNVTRSDTNEQFLGI